MTRRKQAEPFRKPTKAELQAAVKRRVPDVIGPGLKVLFAGINPGLYTAAVGHHFARPGNRFWPALHLGGFTPRQLAPWEEHLLLDWGYGITNLVQRTTAQAAELSSEELIQGGRQLRRKLAKHRPRVLAILGVTAYRTAFQEPKAPLGLQAEPLVGARVWILPSPSGLNAHYQLADFAKAFGELKKYAEGI